MFGWLNIFQKMNSTWDPDVLFSYDTVKEVRIRDRRTGRVYALCMLIIICYVVIYVFMYKKLYLAAEKTTGWITAKVLHHKVEEPTQVFDVFDSITNPGEQGGIFIPTRVLITRGQVQDGFCESPNDSCAVDQDCDIGDETVQKTLCQNGRCLRRSWCPMMELGAPETEEHLVDVAAYDIWFATSIHFHMFALDVGTTDEEKPVRYPDAHRPANTYPVHDLLRMAGVDQAQAQKLGAIVNVNKIFKCDLDKNECMMTLESRAVTGDDNVHQGYNYAKQFFYTEGGVTKRDVYRYYGIRFFAFATGIGAKTSFANIVLQISSAIALLSCAVLAADVCLQYIVAERRHYVDLKVIPTEDFSKDELRLSRAALRASLAPQG